MHWVKGVFEAVGAEGAALSIEEAIAYAQRGRGKRKRPNSSWESLTQQRPTLCGSSAKG
jgi:hypothetical protein